MINQKNIRLIIAMMVLALTGLIAIQIYWINNAIDLERQRFETTVNQEHAAWNGCYTLRATTCTDQTFRMFRRHDVDRVSDSRK